MRVSINERIARFALHPGYETRNKNAHEETS